MKNKNVKNYYEVTITPVIADLFEFLGDCTYRYSKHNFPNLLITEENNGKICIEFPIPGKTTLQKFKLNKSDLKKFMSLNAKSVTTLICDC